MNSNYGLYLYPMKKHLVAPSILAADFLNLAKDIDVINNSEADYLHVDVMDGSFVPNISFGQAIVSKMAEHCTKTIDVHLMIDDPGKYIQSFKDAGADIISVHAEACNHLHRNVHQIKETGALAGVALNPHTPIATIKHVLEDVDMIVLMSVNPGFGGQKFIYETILKIKELRLMLTERNLDAKIEIDGGVGLQNAEAILAAGADVLVAGSSVFKSDDPIATISKLKAIPSYNLD